MTTLDKLIEDMVLYVAEMPDRTSPDDWPEAMLITGDELAQVLRTFASAHAAILDSVKP